jgi:large subunit ribosomal protein L9
MDVILLERIRNLGDLGELVSVKPGFGRNYLIPQKKAVYASGDAKEKVEQARRDLAQREVDRLDVAKARAELATRTISVTRLANADGHLFGSVANVDIAEEMSNDDVTFEKSEIYMSDGAYKEVGQFSAEVILHTEVRFNVTVDVIGEESDMEGLEIIGEDEDAHHLKGFQLPSEAEVGELSDD